MREQIEEWAKDFGFDVQEEGEDSSYKWSLRLIVPSEPPLNIFVAEAAGRFKRIAMQCNISVSEDHLRTLRSLGRRAWATFITDLQLQLCVPSIEVAFDIDADPDRDDGTPGKIAITLGSQMIGEGITQTAFYERYISLQVAFTKTAIMFHRMVLRSDWP